jgi:hypothetical protein
MKPSTLLTAATLISSMLAGPAFASGDISAERHWKQQAAATASRQGEAGTTRETATTAVAESQASASQAHACACGMPHTSAR